MLGAELATFCATDAVLERLVSSRLADIVSFTSLCCLPLLPGYVSFISGRPGSGPARAA